MLAEAVLKAPSKDQGWDQAHLRTDIWQETGKFCRISRGRPLAPCRSPILPVPVGQDPGRQQPQGLSPRAPLLLGSQPSQAATSAVDTQPADARLRKWAACSRWWDGGSEASPAPSALIPVPPQPFCHYQSCASCCRGTKGMIHP